MDNSDQTKIEVQISQLQKNLTGNMFKDMDTQEKIRELKKSIAQKENPLPNRPRDSDIECFDCGS